MKIIYYPDKQEVTNAMQTDEPLLALISYDGETLITACIDTSMEHHILLSQAGFSDRDIDKYFRVIVNNDGADWTFVCPESYKGIPNKQKRIDVFYKDGFEIIPLALKELGYNVPLEIPKRYRRHFDMLGE